MSKFRDNIPSKIVLSEANFIAKDANSHEEFTFSHHSIGFLSAQKLGLKQCEQENLNQAVVKAAGKFTSLQHLQYKENINNVNDRHGSITDKFTRSQSYCFESSASVAPSDAMNSIFNEIENILLIDCHVGLQIICYQAALDYFKEAKFNEFFSNGIFLGEVYPNIASLCSNEVLKEQKDNGSLDNLTQGQIIYLKNIKPYQKKHPNGSSGGYNVVYLGENENEESIFGGLFSDKKPHTYKEIVTLMTSEYNRSPYIGTGLVTSINKERIGVGSRLNIGPNDYKITNCEIGKDESRIGIRNEKNSIESVLTIFKDRSGKIQASLGGQITEDPENTIFVYESIGPLPPPGTTITKSNTTIVPTISHHHH